MVSYLNKDISDNPADSLKFCLPLKLLETCSSSAFGAQQLRLLRTENLPPEGLMNDGLLPREDGKLAGMLNLVYSSSVKISGGFL